MFGKESGGGLVADPDVGPSHPDRCDGLQVASANHLGPVGTNSAKIESIRPSCPGNRRRYSDGRETPRGRRGSRARVQEVAEQHGPVRVGRSAEEVFDPRAVALRQAASNRSHASSRSRAIRVESGPSSLPDGTFTTVSRAQRGAACMSGKHQTPQGLAEWRPRTGGESRRPLSADCEPGRTGAGGQSLISLAHMLRIRASLRSTVLVTQPSRAAISSSVYPSSFQVATLCKVESPSCSISRWYSSASCAASSGVGSSPPIASSPSWVSSVRLWTPPPRAMVDPRSCGGRWPCAR